MKRNEFHELICEKCGSNFKTKSLKTRFCSNSCRAKSSNNFTLKSGNPHNYREDIIRFCQIKECGKKLHTQGKTGYCQDHFLEFYNIGRRGKGGVYQGIKCDSSWELAFLIYHLEHGNEISRNREHFIYEFNGKTCKYFPDFVLNEVIIEIKGYKDKKFESKIQSVNKPIQVLFKEDLMKFSNM